jgi:hypothetical protein
MAQRAGTETATQRASLLPTPEDVCRREGVIWCRHTRESRPLEARPFGLISALAGSDVVLCSSECVGSSAADIAIVASGAQFVVFRMAGRVHVAATRDCAVDELVFAVFVAYCNAASGSHLLFFMPIIYLQPDVFLQLLSF